MKTFLKAIAWLGVLIVGISVPLAYSCGKFNIGMYGMCLFFSAAICAIGVFLLLLGGLISKGRFLWIAALVVGIAYFAVLPRTWAPHETIVGLQGWMDWRIILMSAFPGLVCIVGGVLMWWLMLRSNRPSTEMPHP